MDKRTVANAQQDQWQDMGLNGRTGANVLLVDDDEDFAESLALLLRLQGHQVSIKHRSADALSAFQAEHFDLVILDVRMPEIDGLECFARIRSIDSAARIVFITGVRDEAMIREATANGAVAVLDKPVQLERLFTLLRGD